jgi:hypothetical protein
MIGITPLGDDQRYLLQPASLQTTDGTFVAPGNASLQAATSLLTPDTSSGTWPIPYAAFQQSAGASAYPGTMVVYAAIPTMGLPASDAQEYASFLQFAAATGQTPGSGVSQLPPGYLPMTQADGLGAMVAETEAAAQDVAAQNGQVPVLTAGSSPSGSSSSASASAAASASPSSAHAAGASGGFGQSFAPGQYGFVLPPFSTSSPESPAKRAQSGATTRPIPIEMVSNLLRSAQLLWTSGFPVGLLFGLAALGALSVPMTYRLGRRRGRW